MKIVDDVIEVLNPEDVLGIGVGTDILVVDDDPTNLVAYEAALAPLGRAVVSVSSGTEALASLLSRDAALILMDMTMPHLNGIETARLIRQRPRYRGTPIIFITGVTQEPSVMLAAYEIGALDFISKPIQPDVLRAKISVYLKLQERTQQLLEHSHALQTARITSDEQVRQRDAATAAVRRLEKLQEATASLLQARTPQEVAMVAVRIGAEAVAATSASMWIAQPDGSLHLASSHQVPEAFLDQWRVIPATSTAPAIRVVATQMPVWVENEEEYARAAPEAYVHAREYRRVNAFVALPLVANERCLAVLTFSYAGEHRFTAEDKSFLGSLVHVCAQSLERAHLYVVEADARKAADAANRRKDEFLAMLGHELRNPLAAMTMALELIKLRQAPGREVSVLERQLGDLTNIVDELLDVSRMTQGKITLVREAVPLEQAVASALETVQPLLDQRRHDLTVDVPSGLVLDADRQRLTQVLVNVFDNAARYTPAGGRIEISACADDDQARLVVRDNGRGIPADLMPHIFEWFVQGVRTSDRSEGGLGVGLTQVKILTELHEGSVSVHSDGVGTGATFTLRWPTQSGRRMSPTGNWQGTA